MSLASDTELAASWSVWGMVATVAVTEPDMLAEAAAVLRAEVAAVDAAASRFRADSELTAVNTTPGTWVPVSELLAELVAAALRAAEVTDGAVDPALGTALRRLGYDRDLALVGSTDADTDTDRAPVVVRYGGPRWREVELDRARLRVRVPPGVELDLGATAKACAADRAAAAASRLVGGPVLCSLGGDLAVRGCGDTRPFPVRLAEDHRDQEGPLVWVSDGGVATSTTTARRWSWRGRDCHHLLDPVTGLPATSSWRTVTVSAASCLGANTASTATIASGTRGLTWLTDTGLPARLVGADGAVRVVNGWPEDVR